MPNILHFNFRFYDWCRVCWMLFLLEIAVHRIQPPYANITGWSPGLFSCPPNVAQFQIRISSDLFSRTIVIWKCKCHYFLGNFLLYISDILYPPFSPCVCLDRLAKKKMQHTIIKDWNLFCWLTRRTLTGVRGSWPPAGLWSSTQKNELWSSLKSVPFLYWLIVSSWCLTLISLCTTYGAGNWLWLCARWN